MFEELLVCWQCGKIGVEVQHCIVCDKPSGECECEDLAIFWEHYRCPECGTTW